MRTGRHVARGTRRSLLTFGAALAVPLGLANMAPAMAQVEPSPPDLQVAKTSDAGGSFEEGEPITYTITVTNAGEAAAEGVELDDTLPPGMGGLAPDPTLKGDLCVVASSIVAGGIAHATVSCGPVSLEPGESASVEIDANTNGLCGRIVNSVEVKASNEPSELTGDNGAQAVDQGPECDPDISLDVAASPSEGQEGATITYTYTVTNTGATTLYGINLRDDRLGPLGIDGFSLKPGATDRFTATATLGSSPITSVATATGEDVAGHKVTAQDSVTVAVVAAGGDTGDGDGDAAGGAGGTPFTGPRADAAGIGALSLVLSTLGAALVALTRRSAAD